MEPDMVKIRLDDRSTRNREAALRFCVLYDDKQPDEGIYVKKRRFWELGGVLRIEKDSINATFERSGMTATISNIKINNAKDMRISCVMNHDETALHHDS
ncbi:unnamed protein product [Enterobius vermicularis]|uniref:Ig-like domain-containing protein n=1 Tax=Enterobius vermicularis TaxID=51028 RepID=A0A0N4V692_ENTVE|nr:unnamed protein product [Enterobius vermicularis]